MVFTVTFNNISVISWQSVLLVEETNDSTGSYKSNYHTITATSIIFSKKKQKQNKTKHTYLQKQNIQDCLKMTTKIHRPENVIRKS